MIYLLNILMNNLFFNISNSFQYIQKYFYYFIQGTSVSVVTA